MSPLVRGLRYTTLALALGAVGVGVFGVAGGRLELPWLRIGGAPEIDVSEGPNLTPPGFDAAFFAEQRDPQGELAWRFAGRQAVAESFSAGACSEPELVLYQQGEVALRLEAERARISATDPQGLAWLPGGVSEIRDVVVDLEGGVAVRAGELVLEAAAGRATLVRAVDDADGVPLERAPDAEVARLVLTGPVRVRGRDPAGAEVEGTAAGLTLVASGGTVAAPGWLSLDAEALDGRWGARRLRCAVGRARWARLPSVAAAATGGRGGAVQVAPAAPLGSASYLLVDGALEGDVAVSADGGGARAARVRRVDDGWLAEGAPVRVEATQGSWVEAPRIVARFGRGLELTAEGDVRGEAVAPATSAALPRRWPFSGERLELVAGDGPQRLERAALHGAPATLGAGPSRLRAGRVELEQDPAERTLRLSGGAELELAADLAQGAPLRARLEQGELRLAVDVAALGSLQPQDVRGAALSGLQELAWGATRGRAGRLDYRRDGDRGLLTGRAVDLAVAAVTSDAPAPFELRAQDLFARLDPAGLAGEADPLVRLARTVEEAELRGDARVGRGGPEPRHLSAARIELRDRRLRASGGAALAGTDPRGAWSVAAREARAELARDPARWGSGPATRRWLRDHGLPFVPPPFVERLELEGDVRGTATRQVRDERQQAELRGERLDYDAETRIARLTRGGLSVGTRRLEAEELLAWWTLLGEQPLVWLGARAPVLEGAPPTSGRDPRAWARPALAPPGCTRCSTPPSRASSSRRCGPGPPAAPRASGCAATARSRCASTRPGSTGRGASSPCPAVL
ncbi:MAG: hypothetical protein R3F62_26215 [Planctomycetota bacterium]